MMKKSPRSASLFSAATLIVLGLGVASSAGCAVDAEPIVDENVGSSVMTWEQFLETVYQEPDTGFYIVDGDIPLHSERELEQFYEKNVLQKNGLAVYRVNNADVKWNDTQKVNITYCVSSSSFGTNYSAVVTAMNNAAAAWEAAANVNFVHLSAQDSNCTASNTNVVFDVRQVTGGSYLARAFFPNSARSGRNVLIDTTSFGTITPWTLTGVLRHELGHTLGFRHEHTRVSTNSCYEDNQWRQLTAYDSSSVMHYPQCAGTQTGDLVLTQLDKDGAVSLYGAVGGGGGTPPPTCAHDKCATGVALSASACGSVVAAVCAADSYCCTTGWDSTCVNEVYSFGNSAACAGTCAHAPCTSGAKLTSGCHPVVATVCASDAYCCNTSWDSVCVGEVASIAGKNCN